MRLMPKLIWLPLAAGVVAGGCATTPSEPTKPAAPPAKPISAGAAANMANNCFACHGPNGVSPGSIPSLQNLTAANIAEYMNQFKTGQRPGTVMGRHAKGYTAAEINALAMYIASLNKR
jgi:sulfide dehydrogenase cytochrome subunit